MTLRALTILHGHLTALKGLLARLEPDHIARPTVEARIEECEEALARG